MGGALYHGPEVAPEEFPEQEEEAGGEVQLTSKFNDIRKTNFR